MNDPRLCIIGAGKLASRKIYPYVGLAGFELVGVCDLDAERAALTSRRFGGKPFTAFETMLAETRPDAVIVCVGPAGHATLAKRILELGYPVYTEKPPAPTAAATLEVARTARRAGKLCMTAFKKRYATAYRRAHAWLQENADRDRYSISVDYASGSYGDDPTQRPFLLDFAIHLIDVTGFLFGDARRVHAFARRDFAYAVSVEYANGAVGAFNFTAGRSFGIPTEEVEITLAGGSFLTIRNSSSLRIVDKGRPTEWREPPLFTSAGDSGDETGHGAELRAFAECVRDPAQVPPSAIHESYKSMVLLEAIARSAQVGGPVDVAYEAV